MGKKSREARALQALHNGVGFTGLIPNEDEYEAVKRGEKDWKAHLKSQMTRVQIPAALFYRLMELDKKEHMKKPAAPDGDKPQT